MLILLDRDGVEVVAYDDELTTPLSLTYDGRVFEFEDVDGDDSIYRERSL